MGCLSSGTPLSWEEKQKYADHVRSHGITQFLHIWNRCKDRHDFELFWGDEVEYMVVIFDDENKNAKLSLRQHEILDKLSSIMNDTSVDSPDHIPMPTFHPEFGRYMIESTPGSPYTGSISDLLSVEANMRYRRNLVREHLEPNEILMSITSFPRLGVPGQFTEPYYDPADAVSGRSLFLPDEIACIHVRFPTLPPHVRKRRCSKAVVNLPIFFDHNTPRPFIDPTIPWNRSIYPEDSEAKDGAALPDHVYLDVAGFGMGSCCLQLTFQACDIAGARRLYDALVPIGPIMLALTAASPIWRGYLTDVDCRWNVIAGTTDDRTEEERGLKPLENNRFRIPKSRYDSVNLYMSNDWFNRPEYNDTHPPYDNDIYNRLRDNGIDDLLSKHFAHLFIRDPILLFAESIDQDDTSSTDHFENIQSTNWQSVRFKPPPANSEIGWRVEFRTMEVQMTDYENATFALFILLLSRAILKFSLTFYVPISKVDENMQRAQVRDAARSQKFFFRKNIYAFGHNGSSSNPASSMEEAKKKDRKLSIRFPSVPMPESEFLGHCQCVEQEYEEMTLEEIMNGKGENIPGLIGLADAYIETLDVGIDEMAKIKQYLELIRRRSKGELQTPATWIRDFVRSHPSYKFDSVVNQEINYDLLKAVDALYAALII
ncbi:hypothetical protein APHAL10511_003758 [Amanita phalloides]|nr:hypothetical protein APHAL10511_003758 [Amanita phalloides]